MKYIIIANHPAPNHTENATGTPCLIARVPDNTMVTGPGVVAASTEGFTPINGFVFDKPKPVPASIANWRAKAVLAMAGLMPAVEAALDALQEPQRTVVMAAWNGNADLARNGPTVLALAPVLGLTATQVDDMFRQAAALQV